MKKTHDKGMFVVSPNYCPNSEAECKLSEKIREDLKGIEEKLWRSVLLGAALGSGVGSALKDLLRHFF